MPAPPSLVSQSAGRTAPMTLPEEDVIRGFHSILKDSLAQARGEGLLDDAEIETGDVDIQIAGPALALYFAALGATGHPASISAPDGSFSLTSSNCPPSFASFFELWQASVRPIQKLSSEARHDLALLLCDKEPLSSPLRVDVVRLAGNLKAIGLEITQRRTFQQRFQADLQFALDSQVRPRRSGESDRSSAHQALFVPPPGYEVGDARPSEEKGRLASPTTAKHLTSPRPGGASGSIASSPSAAPPVPRESTVAPHLIENLAIIRETLYSALADCLITTPSILTLLARGPEWASRGFFASTCLAILEVALTRVTNEGVRVVNLGFSAPKVIGIKETPLYLRPFLSKLVEVSQSVKAMAEEDDQNAMREAAEGDITSEPRLERLRERLEKGAGVGDIGESARRSVDSSVGNLANAINELAIGMASLPAFAERQQEVFKVLTAVSSF